MWKPAQRPADHTTSLALVSFTKVFAQTQPYQERESLVQLIQGWLKLLNTTDRLNFLANINLKPATARDFLPSPSVRKVISEARRLRLNVSFGELAGLDHDTFTLPRVWLSRFARVRCKQVFTPLLLIGSSLSLRKTRNIRISPQ